MCPLIKKEEIIEPLERLKLVFFLLSIWFSGLCLLHYALIFQCYSTLYGISYQYRGRLLCPLGSLLHLVQRTLRFVFSNQLHRWCTLIKFIMPACATRLWLSLSQFIQFQTKVMKLYYEIMNIMGIHPIWRCRSMYWRCWSQQNLWHEKFTIYKVCFRIMFLITMSLIDQRLLTS